MTPRPELLEEILRRNIQTEVDPEILGQLAPVEVVGNVAPNSAQDEALLDNVRVAGAITVSEYSKPSFLTNSSILV